MALLIGTSGWQYRHWRGRFYPAALPQGQWLEFYAERFRAVESNNAFYRLPDRSTFDAWRARTPPDFQMAVKMSRYLTHIKRLAEPEEPVRRFLDRAAGLGEKLGPVLLQLPPTLQRDRQLLTRTLARFPAEVRVAVEFRHETWFTDDVRALLTDHGAALCLADRRGAVTPVWRTAPWTYLRFHEGRAVPWPCYGRRALGTWAHRLSDGWGAGAEAWVFFNNDPAGCAIRDARVFAHLAARLGLEPSRIPAASEIRVG